MADRTKIQWCDATLGILYGCTKVSDGCRNCYAARDLLRLQANPIWKKQSRPPVVRRVGNRNDWTGAIVTNIEAMDKADQWSRPRRIFLPSMSDLFHPEVTFQFITQVMYRISQASHHTFIVLTKRADRARAFFASTAVQVPDNLWLGVSAESRVMWNKRVADLRAIPAKTRVVSCEPLLEDLRLVSTDLVDLDWVIVGGESGKATDARPMRPTWARSVKRACDEASVAFFFKQWGAHTPENQREGLLDGNAHRAFPHEEVLV